MNKLFNFLGGVRVLEKVNSRINGKVEVIKSFAFGTYIQVGGLTQSGGVVNSVWKAALKKLKNEKTKKRKNCLILGVGGGGNAAIVGRLWPGAKITGVDIDPVMVEMGKKYFGLDELGVELVIEDAKIFLKSKIKNLPARQVGPKSKFDLILVDLYVGDNYPTRFESDDYIHLVKTTLASGGVAIFNRLYYGKKRKDAVRFSEKLEKIFPKVEVIYPEANVIYICYAP